MKHYTFDIEECLAPTVTKWARAIFGQSKPKGVKMHQMLWWRRAMVVYNSYDGQRSQRIVRFYFKRECDIMMFKLRWA